ncbi:MAG: Txe/YoeB family addiction module toxin [Mycoplasmataceae bacterium]|nr:Txe/YoeB family addiction module toxin [Mycoplasmataceae bacterium]
MKEWRSHHHRNKIHKRIHILINDILASPFKGIGKPEPLKNQNGVWSRRIDSEHRITYLVS